MYIQNKEVKPTKHTRSNNNNNKICSEVENGKELKKAHGNQHTGAQKYYNSFSNNTHVDMVSVSGFGE